MALVRQTPTKGSVMSNTLNKLQTSRRQRGLDGFTLIEMLIVIVVLGVLAAVVVFVPGGVTGRALQQRVILMRKLRASMCRHMRHRRRPVLLPELLLPT
jgi:prepilin-type N-terminal cleavage/methylation domain-containing protein